MQLCIKYFVGLQLLQSNISRHSLEYLSSMKYICVNWFCSLELCTTKNVFCKNAEISYINKNTKFIFLILFMHLWSCVNHKVLILYAILDTGYFKGNECTNYPCLIIYSSWLYVMITWSTPTLTKSPDICILSECRVTS